MSQPIHGERHRAPLPHDTGFLEVTTHMGSDHCGLHLRLTKGSAREYLNEDTAIQKRWATNEWLPLTFLVANGALFTAVAFAALLNTFGARGSLSLPHFLGATLLLTAVAFIGTFLVAGLRAEMRSKRQALAQSVLEQKIGVSERIGTGVGVDYRSTAREVKTVARELGAVTPEVRNRLLRLLREGKEEAAGEAVRLLVDEAPQASGLSRREEREAVGVDARRALGR